MLTHIHIRDFAIVDELDLELAPGMTALTGETGAGKSILVDALGLALGDRGDSEVVRHGAERAEISVSFDLDDLPAAATWLRERELDADGECHLRRVISREGRSRAYVNGHPTPVQTLKELGDLLVDIHGQHEHQSLLRRDMQRQILDDFGDYGPLLAAVADLYRQWRHLQDELERRLDAYGNRSARLDLLRFQVQELDALALEADELPRLDEEHARVAHAGQLMEICQQALGDLYDNEEASAQALLAHAVTRLAEAGRLDPRLAPCGELINGALIQLQEGVDELRRYADGLELDPARLEWLDQRLGGIHQLARKHRVTPEELPELLIRLRTELDELDHSDQRLESLERELAAVADRYREQAVALGEQRRTTAAGLDARISAAMQDLGMPGGRFETAVEPSERGRFGPSGMDQVEFLVSANPGQPRQPLARVASGGELSRISLAIQVIAANSTHIPCLVFDEVDTGIGGGVAEVVGRQLRALGDTHQVLCVTHLPQVAAQARNHLQVSKLTGRDSTRTRIRPLADTERVEEIARMLGGVEITASTLAHAREMIERGQAPASRGGRGKGGRRRKAAT